MTPDQRAACAAPRKLPDWFPPWAAQLAELYFSGTTSTFVLHGNTFDLFRIGGDGEPRYGVLAEFLAEQLFGRWSLVLHYDLGRGLRAFAGRDEKRLQEMVDAREQAGRRPERAAQGSAGDLRAPRSLRAQQHHGRRGRSPERRRDHRPGVLRVSVGRARPPEPADVVQLVTLLNWATSPHVKRLNMAFVLIDERLADVSDRLTGNPHVATIEVPLPGRDGARRRSSTASAGAAPLAGFSDFERDRAGEADRRHLAHRPRTCCSSRRARAARGSTRRSSASLKKRLIERQAAGCSSSSSRSGRSTPSSGTRPRRSACATTPRCSSAARSTRCRWAICSAARSAPARSFLAQCVSGEIGVPCVMLKNFRSSTSARPRATSSACCRCCARWGRWWSSSTRPTRRSATASRTATPARRAACSG